MGRIGRDGGVVQEEERYWWWWSCPSLGLRPLPFPRPSPAMHFNKVALQRLIIGSGVALAPDDEGVALRTHLNFMYVLKIKLMGVWRLPVGFAARCHYFVK